MLAGNAAHPGYLRAFSRLDIVLNHRLELFTLLMDGCHIFAILWRV